MTKTSAPSADSIIACADTLIACGMQYGLWVDKAPSVEEQIALSSMSQDKLGHARAFLQLAEEATGRSAVELQYDRRAAEFHWSLAWIAPLPTWYHLVLAQALFSRALLADLRAFAPGTKPHALLAKIEQEEAWHQRHGDAWLGTARTAGPQARKGYAAALEDLWPLAVCAFGVRGDERFPADLSSGARIQRDAELRYAFLDEVVPLLERAGLKVAAEKSEGDWITDPDPTETLLADLREAVAENALELVALLQDPVGRAMAEL